jgi:hypothetical protein
LGPKRRKGSNAQKTYDNVTDKRRYLILETRFLHEYVTIWGKLESETTYLLDIRCVDEEMATDDLGPASAWPRHLYDVMWSVPWRRGGSRRGKRSSLDGLCHVVGGREESDASPPGTTGVLGGLRAGVLATHGWSRGTVGPGGACLWSAQFIASWGPRW